MCRHVGLPGGNLHEAVGMTPVFIIAEAGVNHNGDAARARALIDAAAQAGADAVKFQTFRPDLLVTRNAQKAEYQKVQTGAGQSQHDMLAALSLDHDVFRELAQYCVTRNIMFLSTPFDAESADFLASLGVPLIKVSSGDLTNLPLLRHIGALKLPVILSTGMATLGEIEASVDALEQAGARRQDITLLHCNTDYPTPWHDVNLRVIDTLRRAFDLPVGYSDHTIGIEIACAAVALGATVIEKHFTLDRNLPGPDHKASLEPDELTALVQSIRHIELAMGSSRKAPTASELPNRTVARRSLVAARPIKAGEVFGPNNLAAKRAERGLSPMLWDHVVGRVARRDFAEDEPVEL
jgi:N,N'-diacetyllegionaminate synthase